MNFLPAMRLTRFLSIAAAIAVMGAGPGSGFAAETHDHEHQAPHGGTLITLGDHAAHLELVLHPADGRLTAYVLDGEAETAMRVKQPTLDMELFGGDLKTTVGISLKAASNPLTGEVSGDTSQFEGENPALKSAKKFNVFLKTLTIKGVPFEKIASPFPEGNH